MLHLVLFFNAFSHNAHTQVMGQLDQLPNDHPGFFVFVQQELAVQLDGGYIQILQHCQRGITEAEVVNGAEKAHFPYAVDHRGDQMDLAPFQHQRFCQLQIDEAVGNLIGFLNGLKTVQEGDVAGDQMGAGKVDGQRNGSPLFQPGSQQPACLFKHIEIQRADFSIAFEQRNKFSWINYSKFRMLPADQHLTAADLFLERAELRLDVELEFMIFNGVLEGFIQHIFTLHLFFKRIVKEAALACLGLVSRLLRPVDEDDKFLL